MNRLEFVIKQRLKDRSFKECLSFDGILLVTLVIVDTTAAPARFIVGQ